MSVSKSVDYETMCNLIFTTMECDDVPRKPELALKLVSATKSSAATCLQTQEEWLDFIRAVEEVEVKGSEPTANIVVCEKVHELPSQHSNKLTLSNIVP